MMKRGGNDKTSQIASWQGERGGGGEGRKKGGRKRKKKSKYVLGSVCT